MQIQPDHCYEALKARDARFDGRFFVGVSTTGIYCRPICSARTPGRDRCQFFEHAAAAEDQGFRPCLRCRPELAPGLARSDARASEPKTAELSRSMSRRLTTGVNWLQSLLMVIVVTSPGK